MEVQLQLIPLVAMPGKVVILNIDNDPIAFHERKRHESLAKIIADIKGYEFGAYYDPEATNDGSLYFVPHYTFVGTTAATAMGIRSLDDFFGGVVPYWFVGTKAVIHSLVNSSATRPAEWNTALGHAVSRSVLPGFTTFSPRDAYEAGTQLLAQGPVRVKDVLAAGGTGQTVVRNASELKAALQQFDKRRADRWSLVVELNLVEDVTTYSIGQVRLSGITISYWGTQQTTIDNSGKTAYGGSHLNIVRGGFDNVVSIAPNDDVKRAVEAAQAFDRAAPESYPELFASRRNYDVAIGCDQRGLRHCGVIDQSWRIGGTSGVEIAAIQIFKERPAVKSIRGSSVNVYGHHAGSPDGAIVHFDDVDAEFGPMLMYTIIENIG